MAHRALATRRRRDKPGAVDPRAAAPSETTPSPAELPDGHPAWRRTLWSMVGVQFIMSLSVTVMAPILPLFLPQIGVHGEGSIESWSGVLNSANFLLSALLAPLWGALSDRYGRKLMVMRASFGVALTTLLMALATSPWQLLAFTLLMGFFGGFSASAIALVAGQVPDRRLGYALGWLSTAQMVGGLAGPVVAGLLADVSGSYRAVFGGTAVLASAALLITLRLVHEPPRAAGRGTTGRFWQRFFRLGRVPGLLPLLAVLMMAQIGVRSVAPIITLYVEQLTGPVAALATLAGFAMSITGVADVLASPFLGRRSDVLGYRRVLLICLLGAALCTAPMALAGSYNMFLVERFGVGLFIGGILPTANALVGRLVASGDRGLVFGATATASLFGAFLGPLVGGSVGAVLGLPAVFAATALLFLIILAWVFAVVREPGGLA